MGSHQVNLNGHAKPSISNQDRTVLPGPDLLHRLIRTSVPENVAIDYLDPNQAIQSISYAQLRSYTLGLANALLTECREFLGIKKVIPVIIPQCPELYISYLAILEVGAAFCPISPDVPLERLKFITSDVDASIVLTLPAQHDEIQQKLPQLKCVSVSIRDLKNPSSLATNDECSFQLPRSESNDAAYIMYTSGSTGLPKGVKIPHQSATQSLMAHDEHIPNFKRFLQFASPTFDVSVFEIFFPFFRGATLVCCEREAMLADLPGTMRALDVDAAELTPTVVSTLLRSRKAVPDLKILLTIGEMLNQYVVSEFGSSDTQESILYAMYGPTEASIHCTIAPQLPASSSVKNIGRPLSTVSAFVLAEAQSSNDPQILAIGAVGELAIGGQLANGYLNRPEQTMAAFIDLPGYGQVYRTGDRALMNNNGEIHILGRISSGQVKLRGQRVELGEVEEVACKTSAVEVAVASIIDDALVLFCSGTDKLATQDVQSICRAWLPNFMRPTEIVLLPEVPRLSSGKIDRKALDDMHRRRSEKISSHGNTFTDDMERKIATCLQHELNTMINTQSVLRSVGLDSLRAIKAVAALRPQFPQISALMLLEADTIHEIAEQLKAKARSSTNGIHTKSYEDSQEWARLKSVIRDKLEAEGLESLVENITPCTPLQIAMLGETAMDEMINFNTIELELSNNVCMDDLEQALRRLATRNEVLRSGFVGTTAQEMPFVQIIWRELTLGRGLDLAHPLCLTAGHDRRHPSVKLHHALYDGWSWDLIMNDLNILLNQGTVARRPSFKEYRRFVETNRDAHAQSDKRYWHENLREASPLSLPELRSNRDQTAIRQSCGHFLTIELQVLDEMTMNCRISRQTIMQAAMVLLLGTYCDASDVLCGIVVSGREQPFLDIERLIGPCLSTYPLRIDLSTVDSVRDLLLYVHRQQNACMKHGSINLSQINQAAGINPTESLFDALCVWQDNLEIPSDTVLIKTTNTIDALTYSVVLEAEPKDGKVFAKLTFDTSRIPLDQAKLMLKQFDSLVSFLATEEPVSLKKSWRSMQLDTLSVKKSTPEASDWSFDLASTIARLAKEDPQRVAVEMLHDFDPITGRRSTEILTYQLLHRQATNTARNLISEYNIQPDDLICIILTKSMDLYISILAIILAGAGYLCVDPRSPDGRIERILDQAECKIIITDDSDRIASCKPSGKLCVTSPKALSDASRKSTILPMRVSHDSLAYAVFTSGSTGTPKGVLLTRRNLLSHICQISKIYPHQSSDSKLLQACSQAFDVSVFEIFWTWHAGMTLCSASNDVLFRDLENFINATAITHLSMTPSVAALINPVNVPTVRFLVTAGEPMNSKVYHAWSDRCLFQGYGPSETTNICNVRPWVSSKDHMNNTGPPFANTSLFVCRRQETNNGNKKPTVLQLTDFVPLPKGAVGEIWVGGDQVGRGYIDPDLTAQSFIDHSEHGWLYRSGDIGRLLADDSLVVLGREDGQVKLRGQRIELGEINSALVQSKQVNDAVTLIMEKSTNARLVTFYVLQDSGVKSTDNHNDALYEWLEERLPSYMIPDMLFPVKMIPLTRQGKVDHRAIATIYQDMAPKHRNCCSRLSDDKVAGEKPSTEKELQIAQALSNVTNTALSRISRTSSFFGLGLDSISSIRLAQQLRKDGLGNVDVSTILKNPSIGRLVNYLKGEDNTVNTTAQRGLDDLYDQSWQDSVRADYRQYGYQVDKILPCTPLQEAMLSSSDGNHLETYCNVLTFWIRGDLESVRRAWVDMVDRHDLLRTAFIESQDLTMPYAQIVLKNYQLSWSEDEKRTTDHEQDDSISVPPYHFWVVPKDDQDRLLLRLRMHHAMYDAEAMSLLLLEVERTIRGEALPPPVPFRRYLTHMINLNVEKTDSFWSSLLRDAEPLRLGNSMSSTARHSSGSTIVRCNARLSLRMLESHAKHQEISLVSLLQTCLARLLSCYTQSDDVCFGNVFGGRNIAVDEVQNIVGPCFNTLPLRAQIRKHTSIQGLSRQLHQDGLDILPFQTSSLRRIQKQNATDGRTLFDVLLLMQQEPLELDSAIWELAEEDGDMTFPYIFEAIPDAIRNTLELKLHCRNYDSAATNTLLQNFDTLLEHAVMFPQALALDFNSIQSSLSIFRSTTELRNGHTVLNGQHEPDSERSWSATEIKVRDVLHDLTKVERLEMMLSTTVFKLGLDSINAVLIASKLRALGFEINSGDILERPSIEEIAKTCDDGQGHQTKPEASFQLDDFYRENYDSAIRQLTISSDKVDDILPCTTTQCGILAQFVKSRGKSYYNRTTISFNTYVDIQRLQLAWEKLMQRHEILRTGFVQLDNAKHPFAMVVYVPGTYPLQMKVDPESNEDPADSGQQIANHLERPGWQLVVSQADKSLNMDIWILHALYDATSIRIMLEELEAIYEHHPLPAVPAWKSVLSKSIYYAHNTEEAKLFWLDVGNDMEATHFPDMNIYYNKDQRLFTTTLSSKVGESDARKQCAELDMSLQSVCEVAWARLLSAYTGQTKVTFGVILSSRTSHDEMENKVCIPCINTVPFAIEIEPTSSSFLRRVSRRNAGCVRHQSTPLNTIKRWNNISGDLFDSVLVLQKFEHTTSKSLWAICADEASAEYAVSIEIIPNRNGCIELQLTSRPNIIPQAQAHIILKEYEMLLAEELNMTTNVDELEGRDKNVFLSALPPHDCSIPTQTSFLHQFVTDTAQRYPDRIAFEFVVDIANHDVGKQTWTYAELDARGNQYANLLLNHDVKVGELVAVCFDKCPEASFAILGILKAGCAYVAIDPGAPIARKSFILEDAGCRIVLTSPDKADNFNLKHISVLASHENTTFDGVSCASPVLNGKLTGNDTCYCLYTSGTTGTPKGCLISHNSAVQAMMSFQRIFRGRWTEESRWLQFASFHFDVSVLEQYWSWSVGICVTSAPRDLLFEDLPGTINKLGITHLDLTPSLARLLNPSEVPKLCDGVFIVGGEQVRQDVLDTWSDIGCLYNFYGPSEVTIGCTVHPQVRKYAKPTNIGQQWDNVGTFVLELHTSKPVIRGAIGELCLSGPLVGKGYLNRPELTSEKFTTIEEYDTRIYRTGDLVRLLHDGSFDFLGRIDDQVKLRGQRLEIGEINHVIMNADAKVEDVSTLVLNHPQQEKEQLVAFYTTCSNTKQRHTKPVLRFGKSSEAIVERLKSTCTQHLPPYMVPTHFIEVDFMPLNINNKTDNKVLKALYTEASTAQLRGEGTGEGSPTEETPSNFHIITKMLALFLGLDESLIRLNSKLFELGLDSISAIALSRVMKREGFIGAHVPIIMACPTVLALAETLTGLDNSNANAVEIEEARNRIKRFAIKHEDVIVSSLGIVTSEIEHIAPCTSLQEGMISKVASSNSVGIPYFAIFTYKLDVGVDIMKLQNAWRRAATCTDTLRTYFIPTEDGYAQVVLRTAKMRSLHLLGVTDPADTDLAFHEWVLSLRNFGNSLPWQVCFTQGDNQEYHMSLFIFHGLYDGLSLPLLLERVATVYQETRGTKMVTPNFYDVLPYGLLRPQQSAKKFWEQQIKEINLLGIRAPNDTLPVPQSRVTVQLHLSSIKKLCAQLNVTRSAIFHASWLHVLQSHYATNPTIGLVFSGRALEIEDADKVVGPLFNTVPCSISRLPSASTLFDLTKACHDFNVRVMSYQHTPIRDIGKWLKSDRKDGLFDSLFVYMNDESTDAHASSQLWSEVGSTSTPDYPLNVEVREIDEARYAITVVSIMNERLREVDIDILFRHFTATLQSLENGDEPQLRDDLSCRSQARSARAQNTSREPSLERAKDNLEWNDIKSRIRLEISELAGVEVNKISLQAPTIFELGLDSIDALKLAARLKKANLTLPVSKVMQFPTIAGMAEYIQGSLSRQLVHSTPVNGTINDKEKQMRMLEMQGINTDHIEAVLNVTPMQEGLLLNFKRYYHVLVYKINVETNINRLSDAIKRVVYQLPILRSTFVAVEDVQNDSNLLQVVQAVENSPSVVVEQDECSNVSQVVSQLRNGANEAELFGQKFRATIAKAQNGSHILFLGMPHALYDGWSIQLLHGRVRDAYNNRDQPVQLSSHISTHVHAAMRYASSQESRDFWIETLQSVQPTLVDVSVELRHACPSFLTQQASKISLNLISRLCRDAGVTLQSIGLTCWASVLAFHVRSLDVIHGIVLSGRTTEGSEELVFPTFNTACFRSKIELDLSKIQTLRKTHERILQVMEHQHFPLKEALRISGCPQEQLFNTLFTFQRSPTNVKQDDVLYEEYDDDKEVPADPPFAINIEMMEKEGQIWWTIAVQRGVASPLQVQTILQQLDQTLKTLHETPHEPFLKSSDSGTSICGLEPVRLKTKASKLLDKQISDQSFSHGAQRELTGLELAIRDVLARVSKTDPSAIQRDVGLFHLGLDSISAIKVSSLLRKEGIRLPVSDLVSARNIGQMASLARRQNEAEDKTNVRDTTRIDERLGELLLPKTALSRDSVESISPASAGQIYMLDTWQASKGRLFYASFWFEVHNTSIERLSAAFATLRKQVPALRTTFLMYEGQVYAVVLKAASDTHDSKSPWTYDAAEDQGKLLVCLKIHHALYDAISLHLMVSVLQKLCHDPQATLHLNTDNRPFLELVQDTSAPAVSWRRRFWTDYLNKNVDESAVKYALTGDFECARIERFVPKIMSTKNLTSIIRREGIGMQALFFAVYARAHARLLMRKNGADANSPSKLEHVKLGIYLANRSLDIDDLPSLSAPTFNIVPLKVSVNERHTLVDVARQIRADLQEISSPRHCGASLRDIFEWTGTQLDLFVNFLKMPDEANEQAVFEDHAINFTHAEGETLQRARVVLERIKNNSHPSPLSVDIEQSGPRSVKDSVPIQRQWCVPAIDIEARIVDDDDLAMGIFAPNNMLNEHDLDAMIEDVRDLLSSVHD